MVLFMGPQVQHFPKHFQLYLKYDKNITKKPEVKPSHYTQNQATKGNFSVLNKASKIKTRDDEESRKKTVPGESGG